MSSIEQPSQYKQPSRKGKKAWRKHVDVTEIQSGLENVREEVIKGGVIAEKPSEELFALDTTGSSAIQSSVRKAHKPLKSDEILAQRSAVPSIGTHKRSENIGDGLAVSRKRRKVDGVHPREYERLREVAYGRQTLDNVVEKQDDANSRDLWLAAGSDDDEPHFTFLLKKQPIKAPSTMKETPKPLVARARSVPAVRHPNPGASYNPEFHDYSALLTAEGAKEVEAEKQRQRAAQKQQDMVERLALVEEADEREAAFQTEDESAWEGFESDFDKPEWLAKKRPERKTPQERKKAERRKERERQEKASAKAKEREKREKRINEFKAEVEREAKAKENRERALAMANLSDEEQEADEAAIRRRAMRKDKLPPQNLELVLPEELVEMQNSLRKLKPEGNLLKDRYRNLLINGKMEARRRISQPKKKNVKMTEKWSHKDFAVPVSI